MDATAVRAGDSSAVALLPDGSHLLASTLGGQLLRLDTMGLDDRLLLELPSGPEGATSFRAIAISGDGARAAVSTRDGRIALCDLGERFTASWVFSRSPVDHLCFSATLAVLVGSGNDGSILVWDVSDADHVHLTHHIASGEHKVRVALPLPGSSDPLRILSVGFHDDVRLWDCGECREEWRGSFGCEGPMTLALSADGHLAAWGGMNHGKVVVWDLDRFEKQCEVACPESAYALQFSPDGRLLAVAGAGRLVRFYDVSTGSEQRRIEIEPPAFELIRSDSAVFVGR